MENKEKKNLQKYWQKIYQKIRDITNLHEDTNIETTLESIKKDVEFKGANVWILFFAVIVCSVGLNINSTAVIIGAML
ncbi:MAG TPA: TIGR00341 family protein, partial [Paludibacteraceae bacterium]|nr:TIGR00341 family protein [Paludibacteraceae bacterium]